MSKWQLSCLACFLMVAPARAQAQAAVRAATAAGLVGQVVIVEDSVAQVARPQGTSDYFLNFGSEFPHQVLTVVVPATVAVQVPGRAAAGAGAFVRVRGKVIQTGGGPAIRCSVADQIEILAAGLLATGGQISAPTSTAWNRGHRGCVGGGHGCSPGRHWSACGHGGAGPRAHRR